MSGVIYKLYDLCVLRPTGKIREFELRFPEREYGRTAWEARKLKPRQIFFDNTVITSKYNLITFVPRSLFEQFRRLANVYFLVISMLMTIGTYTDLFDSSISPWSTLLTLAVVIVISMFKEGAEDLKRHKADNITNNHPVECMRAPGDSADVAGSMFETTTWKKLRVGNIIRIHNNEELPADCILLCSSEPFGAAHVETANIDGETNLKPKIAVKMDGNEWNKMETWQGSKIKVRCDLPNSSIHYFNGNITVNEDTVLGLSAQNVLLRGCRLKNTTFAIALVAYTGKQSKVVMNSRSVPSKLSFLEKTMNSLIYVIFFGQILLSFISLIAYVVWKSIREEYLIYLCYNYSDSVNSLWKTACESTTEYNDAAYFVTFFILYNNFIPISLYVTVELVNYTQAYFFESDVHMYHQGSDERALARTSNMNSDLGMCEYIFSDKTGTLTDNVMNFRMCSVAGQVYALPVSAKPFTGSTAGSAMDQVSPLASDVDRADSTVGQSSPAGSAIQMLSFSPFKAKHVAQMKVDNPTDAEEFAIILALCHSVVIDEETRELRTESPDEEALVRAACAMGWTFVNRQQNMVTLHNEISGEDRRYEVMALIPFTSSRKRMSVVVRAENSTEFIVYSKGADNVMFDLSVNIIPPLVSSSQRSPRDELDEHLKGFASEGLRTLVVAKRTIDSKQWNEFSSQWAVAERALSDRENLYELAAEIIETDFTVVGATAIEDKLQDGVPETIADLRTAGIRLWVLTGDKMETAINIGYSAKLLVPEMILLKLQYPGEFQVVRKRLQAVLHHLKRLTIEVNLNDEPLTLWQKSRKLAILALQSLAQCDWESLLCCCGLTDSESIWQHQLEVKRAELSALEEDDKQRAFSAFHGGTTSSVSSSAKHEGAPLLSKSSPDPQIDLDSLSTEHLALIVDGETLMGVFGDPLNERLFLEIAKICQSVIACRVSPEQKRMMVRLVKNNVVPKPVTVAIGDGANDVAMIQEAQLGIGISGKEGRQAVNASDFAIAQFRYLHRALFVHGRWNYRRTSKVVLFSFYKNIVLSMVVFFFTFFSGYSAQSLFDDYIYSVYNIVLFLPVYAFGVFDRDVSAQSLTNNVLHYNRSRLRKDLNTPAILNEMFFSLVDSVFIFFLPYAIYNSMKDVWNTDGKQAGLTVFGTSVYNILVACMFLRIVLITHTWTWFSHFSVWISLSLFVVFLIVYQYMYEVSYNYYGVTFEMLGNSQFWSMITVTCAAFILFKSAMDKFQCWFCPDEVEMMLKVESEFEDEGSPLWKKDVRDKFERSVAAEDSNRYPLSWMAVKQWFNRLPKNESESLGMQTMEDGPITADSPFRSNVITQSDI